MMQVSSEISVRFLFPLQSTNGNVNVKTQIVCAYFDEIDEEFVTRLFLVYLLLSIKCTLRVHVKSSGLF